MYIAEKNYSDRPTSEINKDYILKVVDATWPVAISMAGTLGVIFGLCKYSIITEASLCSALLVARGALRESDDESIARHLEDRDIPEGDLVLYDFITDQIVNTTYDKIRIAEDKATRKLNQFHKVRYSSVISDLGGSATVDSYYSGWDTDDIVQMKIWNLNKYPYIQIDISREIDLHGRRIPMINWNAQPIELERREQ